MLLLYMGFVIVMAYTVGTIASFGPTILAMPLLLLVKDLYFVRPLLTSFGAIVAAVIFFDTRKSFQAREFLLIIMISSAGLPIGLTAYSLLPQKTLLITVGIITLLVSIKGILEEFFSIKMKQTPRFLLYSFLLCAGLIHGAFTTGGPFLTIYTSQKTKDKQLFRSLQSGVWVIFNTILTIQFFIFPLKSAHALSWNEYKEYLLLLPFLLIALIAGNKIQKKMNVHVFRKIVFLLLFLSAFNILIPQFF